MRFRPKDWPRPKSRRSREEAARDALGFSPGDMTVRILKDVWSDGWERPTWARMAKARGWLTMAEYLAIDADVHTPRDWGAMYEASPFLALLKKDVSW